MLQNHHSFLDIKATLVSWLGELLGVPTYLEAPDDAPEPFITVERIGGSSANIVIDRPIVALQAWAATRVDAGLLANDIASAVALMPKEIPRVAKATISTHQHYPLDEEDTTISRYQVIVSLVTR